MERGLGSTFYQSHLVGHKSKIDCTGSEHTLLLRKSGDWAVARPTSTYRLFNTTGL